MTTVHRACRSLMTIVKFLAIPSALFASNTHAATYYVDFVAGRDTNSGLSTTTPWKRAPGDALATGIALNTLLQPGDVVRFKGGVRYRGSISVRQAGLPNQSIMFDGSGWGTSRALIDGSNLAPVPIACPSQAFCLGAPNWASLKYVPVPATSKWSDWVFSDDKPYSVAQFPTPDEPFAYDDVSQYVSVPLAQLASLQVGQVQMPGLNPALNDGSPVMVLWSTPNVLRYAASFAVTPQGVDFLAPDYTPYTDRANRFSIMNTAVQITKPGQFAISGSRGIAVFWPHRYGARISIGSRRGGFLITGQGRVTIRGFGFVNFAGEIDSTRSGVPITNVSANTGVTVAQNLFRGIVLVNGYGAGQFSQSTGLTIVGNTIDNSPFSSGFRIGNSPGPVDVSCNRISNIGRTGVIFTNVLEGRIRGNYLNGINGIHGNAVSAYLDNRDVEISDNVVVDSLRPLTISGSSGNSFFADPRPAAMTILRNTLVTNDRASSALSSWGGGVANVTIDANLFAGPAIAVRLNGSEVGLSLVNNRLVGTLAFSYGAPQMTQSGNQFYDPLGNGATLLAAAAATQVTAGVCS